MCKIYNSIGSLTTIKTHLESQNIHDFKSVQDLINFQNSYPTYQQQTIAYHQNLIEQEKSTLHLDLEQLDATINSQKILVEKELNDEIDKLRRQLIISSNPPPLNFFLRFRNYLKQWYYKKKINYYKKNLDLTVENSIKKLIDLREDKENRYQYIISHFDDAVLQSCKHLLVELERKKEAIDKLNSFIYGALGEQKVVKVLGGLSEEYFLINDFSISFSAPVYNSQENDYIKSIQIDHLLISPSGIFLIETKNWSEKSLESLSLRSPVEQIKRTNFALFKLLNNEEAKYHLHLDKHHWGDKKIPIRNLIVLTNTKPKEEFQYVKILTLNELIGYIKYFKATFSNVEVQKITDYLLNINK